MSSAAIDTDKLSGTYKDLWRTYQNEEMEEIKDLSYDQLVERIEKWESIEFEARAKRQKDLAEKRNRDLLVQKEGRDKLISNPKYVPTDSPTSKAAPIKIKAATGSRLSREDKLKNTLGELGVDLGDLLKEVKAKKNADLKEGMENK